MNTQKIEIDENELNDMNKYLSSDTAIANFGPDEVIKNYSVNFTDNIRAELDIQNTEDGPYVNAMLFEDNQEVAMIEPLYELHGKYLFNHNNTTYTVHVVAK
jgi:hypothetical protein